MSRPVSTKSPIAQPERSLLVNLTTCPSQSFGMIARNSFIRNFMALPDHRATILREGLVRGKQSQIAMQGLGGDHPVEGVFVNWRQASRAIKHHSLHWQHLNILQPQLLLNPNLRRGWQRELAYVVLVRDLPNRGQAQRPIIGRFAQCLSRFRPQKLGSAR